MTHEKPTVLVVEDEPDLVDLYAAYLADFVDVRDATSGAEARESMSADVDVVLLDRRLPDVMGEELVPEFREQNPDVGIAMVTAVSPEFDILEIGFDDYVVKPVTKEALTRLVRTLSTRSRYGSNVREYFGLLSKRAALLTEYSEDELQEHPGFQTLEARISELQSEVDALLDDFSDADYVAQFRQLRHNPVEESDAAHIRSDLPMEDAEDRG